LTDLECELKINRVTAGKFQPEKKTFKNSFLGIIWPILLTLALFLFGQTAQAAELSLSWNSSAGATGYRVYYGFESGYYIFEVDIGLWTRCTISDLEPGQSYYFAVTAYNEYAESDFSKELSYTPNLCEADLDIDGDVDGSDLVAIISDPSSATLVNFASRFGADTCDN
jgi:hypothetical protein